MVEDQGEGYAPFDLYPYNPSQAPAYAFVGLFGVSGILHLVAMILYRSAFPLPLAIGCGSKWPYSVQGCLIVSSRRRL
jgi:hypothetical protein